MFALIRYCGATGWMKNSPSWMPGYIGFSFIRDDLGGDRAGREQAEDDKQGKTLEDPAHGYALGKLCG